MPAYDRTGPRGLGPLTGRGRGYCAPRFGQDETPAPPIVRAERPPTTQEIALWERAQQAMQRTVLLGHICRLQLANVIHAHTFATSRGVSINGADLPALEARMNSALGQIETLRLNHCEVNGLRLAVYPSATGDDLDIVRPPEQAMGAIWIPIAIGAVVVAGIIARWAYLEKEVQDISDQYNGVLRRADMNLCADPNSQMCKDWEAQKAAGGYHKNETMIDSVKTAVKRVGGLAAKGLGIGIAVAIPLLMMLYLPRPKRKE